jgi:hypothetical protein
MNAKRASQILRALVQGVDPQSGEELLANDLLQNASVLRALVTAIGALDEQQAREARRAKRPANVGRPWTHDEDRALSASFQSGDSLALIAERHGRTLFAIESRLEILGFLTPEQRVTRAAFRSRR